MLAAEDYLAGNPAQDPTGPHYLSYYTDALDANGVAYDVYDVDREGHAAPDLLGVLNHYDAVVWYTGDDYLTRQARPAAGHGHRAPGGRGDDRRPRVPQRGRQAALHGQARRASSTPRATSSATSASRSWTAAPTRDESLALNVLDPQFCHKNGEDADETRRVRRLARVQRGRPDAGRRLHHAQRRLPPVLPGGVHLRERRQHGRGDRGRRLPPVRHDGHGRAVRGPHLGLRRDRARATRTTPPRSPSRARCSTRQQYPLYADSRSLASWLRPGAGPFSPFSGQYYMASNAHSTAYKRLGKTVDLTGTDER